MAELYSIYYTIRLYAFRAYIWTLCRCGLTLFPLSVNRWGIDFWYIGDTITWTWPWRRQGRPKWVSSLFSGNGDFGDARFNTLNDIRQAWKDFEKAMGLHL